jgi:DNA (cytosine-5)-methyltransferase 1
MIDLFAGIGGVRLGFEQAFSSQIKCVFTSEIDKFAWQTYQSNFGGEVWADTPKFRNRIFPLMKYY